MAFLKNQIFDGFHSVASPLQICYGSLHSGLSAHFSFTSLMLHGAGTSHSKTYFKKIGAVLESS
jgi:hypothetical protein